jgi:hypothetical protein
VHDVEAARAQREVRRLRVDHDVVALGGGADHRDVADRGPRAAPGHVDDDPLLGPRRR